MQNVFKNKKGEKEHTGWQILPNILTLIYIFRCGEKHVP
jgi:hypothetical protein